MTGKRLTLLLVTALLGSCGKVADLKPAAGQSLPVKPLLARTTPTPEQLLTPPPYAAPERVDELMKKSAPRAPDPFDLPPPSGGAAPALPIGSDANTQANETGPATPQ
jgi:hypothetical protein